MKHIKFNLILLLLSVIVLTVAACSIVGAIIGSNIHKRYTSVERIPMYALSELKKRDPIVVYKKGQSPIEGTFLSVTPNAAGDQNMNRLIMLVKTQGAAALKWTSIGYYEIDSVLALRSKKMQKRQVFTHNWEIIHINKKSSIVLYKKDGTSVKGRFMGVVYENEQTRTGKKMIKIRNKKAVYIPEEEISYVEFRGQTNYALKGFIIGLAYDAAAVGLVVYAAQHAFDNFSLNLTASSSSCPYVYASDGKQHHFEGELYVGSFYKGAQRTDVLQTPHLKPYEGKLRLRIANELDETEYVDQLSLLAVDHPAGTRIVPDGKGELWALGQGFAPVSARDDDGYDVLPAVTARDQHNWLANPFGRNPAEDTDLRDEVVLEFDHPGDANSAVLAITAVNTPWSVNLQSGVMRLPGSALPLWYDQVNSSPEMQRALHEAMIREIMLQVSVWDGKQWQAAGHIWEPGAVAEREMALLLTSIPSGDRLKIKLECPPGTWVFNSVSIDYSASRVKARELPIAQAVDGSGQSVAEALQSIDGKYYEMPYLYQYADVTFDAPAIRAGEEQSYLVQCTGYYQVHVKPEGDPQFELMERLVREPGAFNRYALEQLNAEVRMVLETQ